HSVRPLPGVRAVFQQLRHPTATRKILCGRDSFENAGRERTRGTDFSGQQTGRRQRLLNSVSTQRNNGCNHSRSPTRQSPLRLANRCRTRQQYDANHADERPQRGNYNWENKMQSAYFPLVPSGSSSLHLRRDCRARKTECVRPVGTWHLGSKTCNAAVQREEAQPPLAKASFATELSVEV